MNIYNTIVVTLICIFVKSCSLSVMHWPRSQVSGYLSLTAPTNVPIVSPFTPVTQRQLIQETIDIDTVSILPTADSLNSRIVEPFAYYPSLSSLLWCDTAVAVAQIDLATVLIQTGLCKSTNAQTSRSLNCIVFLEPVPQNSTHSASLYLYLQAPLSFFFVRQRLWLVGYLSMVLA